MRYSFEPHKRQPIRVHLGKTLLLEGDVISLVKSGTDNVTGRVHFLNPPYESSQPGSKVALTRRKIFEEQEEAKEEEEITPSLPSVETSNSMWTNILGFVTEKSVKVTPSVASPSSSSLPPVPTPAVVTSSSFVRNMSKQGSYCFNVLTDHGLGVAN